MMSYKGKLLLYFTATFILFSVVFIVFQQVREHEFRRELLESRLRSYADLAAGSVEKYGIAADSTELGRIVRLMPGDLRLTVLSHKGQVYYDSDTVSPQRMDDHTSRPEVKKALVSTTGSDVRQSATTGREYFYFAKSYGGFIIRVALPYDSSVQDFMKANKLFLWFALLVFPFILVMLVRISDHFGKSIASLHHFIDSAERGLVDYEHISFPHSELGDIGRAIMTKYKQQEESARLIAAERERLMRHFHHFEEGIAIFSPERRQVYANPRFMQYANSILDRPTADVSTIWEQPVFAPAAEFLSLNGGQRDLTAEAPVFRHTISAGGSHIALQLLVYADGSFEMTLADVTRAEKTRLLKQQMSNNITHELRTPVSSIRGYLETLICCPALPDGRKQTFIEKAHAQTLRLTDLIRDVALITKTEEAPDLIPREQTDLAKLAAEVAEELQSQLQAARMTTENRIPQGLNIRGSYSLLYAIFRNLMENSIRYAGEGTRICLECYSQTAGYAYFRYYDTGGGVPEEHLKRLFERFYRVAEGRTRDCGGTGLGLSIVRNAVHFHAGNITVRNRAGGGLEFLFTLSKG